MATIRPFPAVRPQTALARAVASPAYDTLNSEEAKGLSEERQFSFLKVIKPEVGLPSDVNPYEDIVYETGKKRFYEMIDKGILVKEDKPCFYVYRITMNDHVQTGLGATFSVNDYISKIIKEHEKTRQDKEDDRTRHIDVLNAQTGPVFLAYQAQDDFKNILSRTTKTSKPVADFASRDGIKHMLWKIENEETIQMLTALLADAGNLYIADGHHRSAAAVRVSMLRNKNIATPDINAPHNFFVGVLFPQNELAIMDYNRVVKDLNGFSNEDFLKKLSENFNISKAPAPKPTGPKSFGMYLDGQWHRLKIKPEIHTDLKLPSSLDVNILQDNLLDPLLNIKDPKTDKRIDFVGGIRGTKELEKKIDSGDFAVAFSMFPVTMEDFMAVSDQDLMMPPKSTWFEPKLRSGLLSYLI